MPALGLDSTSFLRDYWQQQPLLLKGAVAAFTDPLSPEELAGLACEEDVEARLVFHKQSQWQLESGPFTEDDFLALPERDWSLLVQSVDLWQPELKSLFSLVDFLPAWRRDDLMISFATPGAGTGPHFDYYDVFILQGQGKRRWQLGQWCDTTTPLDTRSGLKILRHFEAKETFELSTGDLLYIPPGLAHQGISHDNSLSYSIGFRAPSAAELLNELAHEAEEQLPADLRYRDPPAADSINGHIGSDIQAMLTRLVEQALQDPTLITRSFARHMTRPRYPELMPGPEHMAERATVLTLAANGDLIRNPASRFTWFDEENAGNKGNKDSNTAQLTLVCDGEIYQLADNTSHRQALTALCSENAADLDCSTRLQQWRETAGQDLHELMTALYNNGALISRQELDANY